MRGSSDLKQLYSYIRPYRGYFYLCIFLTVLLAVMGPIRPRLMQLTIDDYTQAKLVDKILWITLIQIGFLLIESITRYAFMYYINLLGQSVVLDMRDKIFKKISLRNIDFFHKNPVGMLSTRVINDMESVSQIFSDGMISILGDILLMISVLAMMLYTNVMLTVISLITLPLIWVATMWFKKQVKISYQRVRNAIAQLNTFVQERLSGLYVIQAFGKEQETLQSFDKLNKEYTDANIQTIFAYAVYFPIVELLSAISVVILVWYGALGDGQNFTTGQLVAFIMYINMLFRPLRMLADKFNVLQMGLIALDRVLPLMQDGPDSEHGVLDEVTEEDLVFGPIEYRDVSFTYEGGNPVLENMNLHVKPGESIAIIGPTGAGKTTIINLLNRLYDHYTGTISIGDDDIQDLSLARLRHSIGMITQDVMLISGSLRENILMQNQNISIEDLDALAERMGIKEYIDGLQGGWEYSVGHRGSALSTGQKQLVAFMRVMLMDPKILVLDEATASIDLDTEQIIQRALDKIMEDHTMIIIAHRLHTIKNCDSIYLLQDKKLEAMKSYQQIVERMEELGIMEESPSA